MHQFKAIAAMSLNRVIGCNNRIPWHLPEDLQWFKRLTLGHVLVMGRKTFQAIGRPLPGRTTLVLSRTGFSHPGVQTVPDLQQLGDLIQADPVLQTRQVFICGGAQVYAQALPLCSDLYLTVVKQVVDGDAFFPPFEHLFVPVQQLADGPQFKLTHYRNVRLSAPNC